MVDYGNQVDVNELVCIMGTKQKPLSIALYEDIGINIEL